MDLWHIHEALETYEDALTDGDWQAARRIQGSITAGLDAAYREARKEAGIAGDSETEGGEEE
jgi:hypothetical protein